MKKDFQKVILITGASSGIGSACARHLLRQGLVVFGTSRIQNKSQLPYHNVIMDVTDLQSVKAGIEYIYQKAGRIDIMINNAGIGIAGAVSDTSLEEAQHQFDTNFFGVLRVCQQVIPLMKSQQHGMIINMSSLAGLVSVPYQGLYSASKFALEGASQAMRMELAPHNIKVVLVNPGDFKTSFTDNRYIIQKYRHSPSSQFAKTLEVIKKDEQKGSSPEKVGRLVAKIIQKKQPKANYLVGSPTEILFAKLLKFYLPGQKRKYWPIIIK